jgi:hypothetical protein
MRALLLALLLWNAGALAQTPPSLDGTPVSTNSGGSSGVQTSPTITTTGSAGILVTGVFNNSGGSVSSVVSSPALTWTQRGTGCDNGTRRTTIYTAPYTSSFSGTVTVTISPSQFVDINVFAVKGSAASPFDANGPVCATPGGGANGASMTTATNHVFVFCNMGLAGGGYTAGTGWTTIAGTSGFQAVEYQTASGGGSFTCTVAGGGSVDAGTIDAFTADTAGGGGGISGSMMLTGIGQ